MGERVDQMRGWWLSGADRPHPSRERRIPEGSPLVDLLARAAPTPDLQRTLLIRNPMRTYWPEKLWRRRAPLGSGLEGQ